jgi:ABC-type uncharacterized transport system permease subunit
MDTFWAVVTIALVVAIITGGVWALVIEPLRVPHHHGH